MIAYRFNKNTGDPDWQKKVGISSNNDDFYWNVEGGTTSNDFPKPLKYFNALDKNRLTIGFKAFYEYYDAAASKRTMAYCHINAIADTGLNVINGRIITIPFTAPLNTYSFIRDWEVQLNGQYQFCFSNREIYHKNRLFAVIDSADAVIQTSSLSDVFSSGSGIRGVGFKNNGLSVIVSDTISNAKTIQQLDISEFQQNGYQTGCGSNTDTAFFTVAPVNLVTENFDAGFYKTDIINTEDFTVSTYPFYALSNTICKTINVCDKLILTGDSVACVGNTAYYKVVKNATCNKRTKWLYDTSLIKVIAKSDSGISVQFLAAGTCIIKASLNDCVFESTLKVKVYEPVTQFTLGNDKMRCNTSDYFQLNIPLNLSGIQWMNGDTSHNFLIDHAGTYWVTSHDGCGNEFSDTLIVRQSLNADILKFVSDTVLCQGNTLMVLQNSNFFPYLWEPQGGTMFENGAWNVTPSQNTQYKILVTDTFGCTWQYFSDIKLKKCDAKIWLPSAFSPNNDGLNDDFGAIVSQQPQLFLFNVWNRWGQKVFYTNNSSQKWDGNYRGYRQSPGSYTWECHYQFKNGVTKILKGTVLLLK